MSVAEILVHLRCKWVSDLVLQPTSPLTGGSPVHTAPTPAPAPAPDHAPAPAPAPAPGSPERSFEREGSFWQNVGLVLAVKSD